MILRSRKAAAAALSLVLALLVGLAAALTGAMADDVSRGITWSAGAPQPYGTLEGMAITAGSRIYSFGGYDVPRVDATGDYTPTGRSYVYDPAAQTWTAIAPLPAMNGSGHPGDTHAGIATDGRDAIYLAGGYTADPSGDAQIFGTVEVWRYDIATDTYARLPDLPEARAAGGLAYLDGVLHFFGGTNRARDRETGEHWALDLADAGAGWTARAPLPDPRNHLGTAVIDGRIYVVGGQTGQDQASTSRSELDVYDPATDTWTRKASLPIPLSHTVATPLDGRLVVMAGQTAYNQSSASVFLYDPATDRWATASPLPAPRFAGVAATVGRTLFYLGGSGATTTYRGTPAFDPPSTTTPTQPAPPPATAVAVPAPAPVPVPVPPADPGAPAALATGQDAPLAAGCDAQRAAVTRWRRLLTIRSARLARDRRIAARHPGAGRLHTRALASREAVLSAHRHVALATTALAACRRAT